MIVLVNSFTLKTEPETFEKIFAETAKALHGKPGFLSHRLARSNQDPNSYVNIAEWESEEALRAAITSEDFKEHAMRLREVATSDPRVFTPALEHAE